METKALLFQMVLVEIYSRRPASINHSLSGMKRASSTKSMSCHSDICAGGTGVCPQEAYVPGFILNRFQRWHKIVSGNIGIQSY